MKTFYVTFGLGTVLGKNYLIAYAPDENTLRARLNDDSKTGKLPNWAGCYEDPDKARIPWQDMKPLATAYEAVSVYHSGPCRIKEPSA